MAPVFLNKHDKYYNKIAKFNAYLYSKLLASSTHICIFFECLQHKIGNCEQLHFHSNIEMNEQRNEAFMAARALKKVCNKFSYFICLSFPFYFLAIFEVFFLFYFRLQSCTVVVRINIF